MTKDEADEKVAEARNAVLDFARRISSLPHGGSYGANTLAEMAPMIDRMRAAERARADLDKPRLMTTLDVWCEAKGAGHPEGWRAVSRKTRFVVLADLLTQAEKLVTQAPIMDRPITDMGMTIIPNRNVVLWDDLKALINGT